MNIEERGPLPTSSPKGRMGTERRPSRRNTGRLVSGGLVVLCLAVVGASLPLEAQARDQSRRDAVARAVDFVDDAVASHVGVSDRDPLSGEGLLALARLARRMGADGDIHGFRLWSVRGDLIFSSGDEDAPVRTPAGVRAAAGGAIESPLSGGGVARLLQTFVPVPAGRDPSAVAEVHQLSQPIQTAVHDSWNTIRAGTGGVAALFLSVLLLSFARRRRGGARSEAGFSPRAASTTSAPGALSRSNGSEKQLERSEQARIALEEQLGQLRTQAAETEARSAERARVFGDQVAQTEARIRELEGMLKDAEARASRTAHEAPFAQAVHEGGIVDAQVARLEQELTETRSELEGSRVRITELEPLLAQSAARIEEVDARANKSALAADARAQQSESKVEELQRKLRAAETRAAEMERYVTDSEQRLAGSADVAEGSALRIRELEGKLEAARRDSTTADLEKELAAAHRAGKEAVRLASEARAELERTQAELEAARSGARDVEDSGAALPANGHATDDEELEDEGPSLRFRLARSAARRKGSPASVDEAWSSPAAG